MYLIKKIHQNLILTNIVTFPKKYFFMKFHHTNIFIEQSDPWDPKQKQKKFQEFYLKAEGRSILEHPGVMP